MKLIRSILMQGYDKTTSKKYGKITPEKYFPFEEPRYPFSLVPERFALKINSRYGNHQSARFLTGPQCIGFGNLYLKSCTDSNKSLAESLLHHNTHLPK